MTWPGHHLHLVGLYHGPYFGIMELQARWAAALLSGTVAPPTAEEAAEGLARELEIRDRMPRPQFPHGEYVAFADELAAAIGVFRLSGPHANIEAAKMQIESACDRVGPER